MRQFVAILSIIPVIAWFFVRGRKKDVLSPINIVTILYVIEIAIPILVLSDGGMVNNISNEMIRAAVGSIENYAIFVILSVISYFLIIFGIKIRIGSKALRLEYETAGQNRRVNKKIYKRVGIVLWVIGLIATLITLRQVGGIGFLMQNQSQRTTILRDLDLLSWIRPLLSYGLILIIFSREKKISIAFLLFIIATGLMQGLGTRRIMVMLVIESLFIYHYAVEKIKLRDILKFRYVCVGAVIYMIFSFLLFLRGPNATNDLMQNINSFSKTANLDLIKTVTDESYVKHHMLTVSYFKEHNYWYGKTFIGLATSIIPSALYTEKPPVDDGTYLYSISRGRVDINPPMSFKQLNTSSLPLETFSSMYANFGAIGVLIGSLLKGIIIGYVYRKMRQRKNSLLLVYIYTIVLFSFELSTLSIFQTTESILIMSIVISLTNHFLVKNRRGMSAACTDQRLSSGEEKTNGVLLEDVI